MDAAGSSVIRSILIRSPPRFRVSAARAPLRRGRLHGKPIPGLFGVGCTGFRPRPPKSGSPRPCIRPCTLPRVELTPLRYFRAIVASGHMTRAARALGVTQPALSAALKKLEAEAGTELLHRTGRGVELTDAGRVFLAFADESVLAAEAGIKAVRELIGLETGGIRVGGGATATAYLLPPVIARFRRTHPGLRFYIREAGSSGVAQAVASGELDLGIVTLPLTAAEDALATTPLVEDELRLIVPPGHRLAAPRRRGAGRKDRDRPREFRWRDLAGEPVVAFEAGSAVREVIDAAAARAGVSLGVVMELRSIESIKQMVAAGVGVAVVSRFALREGEGLACAEGRLIRRLAIARRRDRRPSHAAAAFEHALLDASRGR